MGRQRFPDRSRVLPRQERQAFNPYPYYYYYHNNNNNNNYNPYPGGAHSYPSAYYQPYPQPYPYSNYAMAPVQNQGVSESSQSQSFPSVAYSDQSAARTSYGGCDCGCGCEKGPDLLSLILGAAVLIMILMNLGILMPPMAGMKKKRSLPDRLLPGDQLESLESRIKSGLFT
ncbi:hypothetical protein TCAL_14500 [Tigriopus californicus]|uniref:Uncharacterized protein n=1 Tax=Tigriopus californicus TaxID=6832 RepID=A0A553PSR6_TIGCA|nr:hypothetical protein TCAL_14500 [Tigriopus californicus]